MATTNAVTVTEANLHTGIVFQNSQLLFDKNSWHKFIIENAEDVPRNVILQTILDYVHPLDLIPTGFGKLQLGSYFIASDCAAAIQKLCNGKLVVPNPNDSLRPFKLTIIMNSARARSLKENLEKNILAVLNKRYDTKSKTLDLTKFHENLGLTEYCPLSQPRMMSFVMQYAKSLTPFPEKVILCENRIRGLKALEAISGLNSVISLDFGNNLIDDVKELLHLKMFRIQELVLDGNPVCDKYNFENYTSEIRNVCIDLKKLDGLPLKEDSLPIERTNFFCNIAGFGLVSKFLEHYFTVYDSGNRRYLEQMYHKDAFFSVNTQHTKYSTLQAPPQCKRCYNYGHITNICTLPYRCGVCAGDHASRDCNRDKSSGKPPKCVLCEGEHMAFNKDCPVYRKILKDQEDSNMPNWAFQNSFAPYNVIHRNLNFMSGAHRLIMGNISIVNALCNLPFSEHDPYSFKVDLMHHTASCAVIGITGVFRSMPKKLTPRLFGFKRTFVIEIVKKKRLCYIVNDMFHLYNALSSQVTDSFKYKAPVVPNVRLPQNKKEQEQVIETMRIISGLNIDWSRRYLEENNYDLKKALGIFVDLYKADEIPTEGFQHIRCTLD